VVGIKHVGPDVDLRFRDVAPNDLCLAGIPDLYLYLGGKAGFRTLVACYYDADDLKEVKGWLQLARQVPNVRGFMYTPWQKKYSLLPAFGDLLREAP